MQRRPDARQGSGQLKFTRPNETDSRQRHPSFVRQATMLSAGRGPPGSSALSFRQRASGLETGRQACPGVSAASKRRPRLGCIVLLHHDMNRGSFRCNNALDFVTDLNDRIMQALGSSARQRYELQPFPTSR